MTGEKTVKSVEYFVSPHSNTNTPLIISKKKNVQLEEIAKKYVLTFSYFAEK